MFLLVPAYPGCPRSKAVKRSSLLYKKLRIPISALATHTHIHPFNSPLSRTTEVSQYQKGKSNLDFTEARDSEWQWHPLGHMQVCTSLKSDNHDSTPPLNFFYRLDLANFQKNALVITSTIIAENVAENRPVF